MSVRFSATSMKVSFAFTVFYLWGRVPAMIPTTENSVSTAMSICAQRLDHPPLGCHIFMQDLQVLDGS
jgi:hypothetical protein